MELSLFILALIALALLAQRFGVDSRPGYAAIGHDLAWTQPAAIRKPVSRTPAARARRAHLAGAGIPVRSPSGIAPEPSTLDDAYPLLGALDRAAGPGAAPLARDRCAARLERTARALTDQRWSEHVWLTGLVDQERLDAVRSALDRKRATT
jgi:hypothetical protein